MMTICIRCGYLYQGKEPFRSLADNWVCPDCGASIDSFAVINEVLPEKNDEILNDLDD